MISATPEIYLLDLSVFREGHQQTTVTNSKGVLTMADLQSNDPKHFAAKVQVIEKGVASSKPATELPPLNEAEETDNEWLHAHCGKLLGLLPFKTAYKQDAILYRRIINRGLAKFRGAMKKPLAEAKKTGENGSFFAQVIRVVKAAHPMHWLMCDACLGWGHVPGDRTKMCMKCVGGGYKVTFEET